MFFFNLIKYYFAFKTRLKISDQKLLNFAECIAGKGKFCGRVAAASCAKNYGDRMRRPGRVKGLMTRRQVLPTKFGGRGISAFLTFGTTNHRAAWEGPLHNIAHT